MSNLNFYGRFNPNDDGSFTFDWSGSRIECAFECCEIAVNLSTRPSMNAVGDTDYLLYNIDGGEYKTLPIPMVSDKTTYKLTENLDFGYHYVNVVKKSEMQNGAVITFYGFDCFSGNTAKVPNKKDKSIWFIGDSITAGYGTDSTYGTSGFSLTEQDVTKTYGWRAAIALDADYSATSISGAGIHRDCCGGDLTIWPYYNRTVGNDANTVYEFSKKPDIIVVNLGTNDFVTEIDPDEYLEKYRIFINGIRNSYTDSYIVCAMGPMTFGAVPYVKQVVDEAVLNGDKKIAFCLLKYSSENELFIGSDGHPTSEGHKDVYMRLVDCINNLINH